MGSTAAVLEANLRFVLSETAANEWTSARLRVHLSRAQYQHAAWLSQLKGSDWFQYSEDITLAADVSTFDLTGLTKTFAAMKFMELKNSAGGYDRMRVLPEGDDSLYRTVTAVGGATAPFWYRIQRPTTLFFLPVSASARTAKAVYRWKPAALTNDGDTADTVVEHDDVLELRAAILALADEQEKDPQLEGLLSERLAEIEALETEVNAEGLTRTVKNVTSRHLF